MLYSLHMFKKSIYTTKELLEEIKIARKLFYRMQSQWIANGGDVAAMGKFNLKGSNRDYWKIDIFWNWLEEYQVTKPKHDYEEADRQQVIGVLNVSRQKDIV